ncbi:uncharacterized protein LOC129941785 [Eupeodes corollae]|uniref:uncharacterized protein LOC129941785 n=1 Tax=Eupeodes corollae TaxID=290404 RepID=UPI00249086AA|nr:uncharacterized protein LOC129941785 [Eupeodes corollae]
MPEESKQPLPMSKDCICSKTLVEHLCYSNYLAGPKALVALTRQRFWSTTNFHFIPPRAPHLGGIWETAVKVAKGHLYRRLGGAKLSFEELSTALLEIEAIMNSRPITPMSTDPNDVEAQTPAHLLIGSSLKAVPQPI